MHHVDKQARTPQNIDCYELIRYNLFDDIYKLLYKLVLNNGNLAFESVQCHKGKTKGTKIE